VPLSQNEREAKRLAQLVKRPFERQSFVVFGVRRGLFVGERLPFAARAFAFEAHVERDAIHPRPETGFAFEAVQVAKSLHESILRGVFGLRFFAQNLETQIQNARAVRVHQGIERRHVAVSRAFEPQFVVAHIGANMSANGKRRKRQNKLHRMVG